MSRQYRPGSARLAHFWESLRTSFWFVPTLMTAGAIALSFASVHLDELVQIGRTRPAGLLWAGSPDGARQAPTRWRGTRESR